MVVHQAALHVRRQLAGVYRLEEGVQADEIRLELVLLGAQARPLLLPERVGLDDVSNVDDVGEELLEDLEDGLDSVPRAGAAPHVDHHRETHLSDVVTETQEAHFVQHMSAVFGFSTNSVFICHAEVDGEDRK